MDAVNYINTIDALGLRNTTPYEPEFAVVDLAVDDQFLSQLYGGMKQAAIEWFSLFMGSSWQENWKQGPVLLDLSGSPDFSQELMVMMEVRSLGVLIHSGAGLDEMRQHCQRWLFKSDASILRYYEPRMLTALLATMTEGQSSGLVRPGESWTWHNGQDWVQYQPTSENLLTEDQPPCLTSEQLRDVHWYRLAAHAREYAEHYRDNLVSQANPQTWIMKCLMKASESGFRARADQERWLRLAIKYGDTFHQQDAFRIVMEQQALAPADQLTAMESNSESLHA
jgi:Domain of unknown function (DUF4123)